MRAPGVAHRSSRFAKCQLPDEGLFVESIPLTSTGKVDKKAVRAELEGRSQSSRAGRGQPASSGPAVLEPIDGHLIVEQA